MRLNKMDKYSIIKGVHKTLNDKIIKSMQNTTKYDIIPGFLYYYDRKLLNYRVNDIIKHKYSFTYKFTDINYTVASKEDKEALDKIKL